MWMHAFCVDAEHWEGGGDDEVPVVTAGFCGPHPKHKTPDILHGPLEARRLNAEMVAAWQLSADQQDRC